MCENIKLKCSTKTFIAKTIKPSEIITLQQIRQKYPDCKETKFRNCVIKKIDKKCVKLYTNASLQINGIMLDDDICKLFEDLNLKDDYIVKCVMSNWTLKLSNKKIDLKKTMTQLNNNNITSYFLRGIPLIIKYNVNDILSELKVINTNGKYTCEENKIGLVPTEVSILMFKSGSCIISGKTEYVCKKAIIAVKKHIVHLDS